MMSVFGDALRFHALHGLSFTLHAHIASLAPPCSIFFFACGPSSSFSFWIPSFSGLLLDSLLSVLLRVFVTHYYTLFYYLCYSLSYLAVHAHTLRLYSTVLSVPSFTCVSFLVFSITCLRWQSSCSPHLRKQVLYHITTVAY